MATNESLPGNVQQTGSDVGKTIDLIVKATVIIAAVIYGCGFLVISIHQFRYGLVELNSLRPRVLAAGIWFLFFATIPFVIEIEGNSIKSSSPEFERWRRKRSTRVFSPAVRRWPRNAPRCQPRPRPALGRDVFTGWLDAFQLEVEQVPAGFIPFSHRVPDWLRTS